VWVTFDTPVNDDDEPDAGWVGARLDEIAPHLVSGMLVVISSQVPVGFSDRLAADWRGRGVRVACVPENLRLGKAIESFTRPARWVVGANEPSARETITALLKPFRADIEWMSVASAEMSKHALNAFLAVSVSFINEIARVSEAVGADAADVERALKSEPRIGPKAYLKPGAPFAGGTLARDLHALVDLAGRHGERAPLVSGAVQSNDVHKTWLAARIVRAVEGIDDPTVTLLGLVYRPDTSTLRRSLALEIAAVLSRQGVRVQGHDPAVAALPDDHRADLQVCADALAAIAGSDLAVVTTEWPVYRALPASDVTRLMRRARVLDPGGFLERSLGRQPGIAYFTVGRAPAPPALSAGSS
jgi:UDPglucose 6-dehydrogenase